MNKIKDQKFIEDIVNGVISDFEERKKQKQKLVRQWELNLNFLNGNQYCAISKSGEILQEDKEFLWQNRRVFNHIAPIIDSRLAKFSRVTPSISVRPNSSDDSDEKGAILSKKLIDSAFIKTNLNEVVKTVTKWSEGCGTGFYKIVWKNDGGDKIGKIDEKPIFAGDIDIIPISPFEIFPDSLFVENLENCNSIIHARAVSVDMIYEKYGVLVDGENIGIYDLNKQGLTNQSFSEDVLYNSALVIEKYEKPSKAFPKGRLITIAKDKLLYYGDLPYFTDSENSIIYPFIKQTCAGVVGEFFGTSLIERMIPIQRAYNAVKNRKHEFINRLSSGIMTVEDGSLDTDNLADEGLAPGKILIYRQGADKPEMMKTSDMPSDFDKEEDKLLNEFVIVSGVSDVISSNANASVSSGSALKILIEQDNEKMLTSAEEIRRCFLDIAKITIKLYSQFIKGVKAIKCQNGSDKYNVCYIDKSNINSFDCYLESENELLYTENEKKQMLLSLYESGILSDENGVVPQATKEKVLSLLGYKDLDAQKGIITLQEQRAEDENEIIKTSDVSPCEIDNHAIHILEHTRYVLSEFDDLEEIERQRFYKHIKEHKEKESDIKNTNE